MELILLLNLIIIFVAKGIADNRTSNRIFKLPRLIVHSDHLYLQKNEKNRLSCQIEPGWPGARFSSKVLWFKDGTPIVELNKLKDHEILERGPTLLIHSGRSYVEGNYQCKAEIEGIRLSKDKKVTVKLISAPLKLRKARISRFTEVRPLTVEVELDSIARIPCEGLPDVVPGPPAIGFQKQEDRDRSVDERDYWVTSTGMQLVARKYGYAGTYFCSATNVYTNITRKSRSPVKLQIIPKTDIRNPKPQLIFPLEQTSLGQPIVVNINRGRSALLECIVSNAQVSWKRFNSLDSSLGPITIGHDPESKFRLRFNNLDINWVDEDDSGVYVCEGRPLNFQNTFSKNFSEIKFPRVFYKLHVRAPTNVQLDIGHLQVDKTWELQCLGINVDYEIPIVYINGDTLQDAMDSIGVPPSRNFYSNPIKVTLTANTVISGSVQCLSRPAMDEAEIYGDGLERGRAVNLYVDNSEQMQVNLITEGPQNVTVTVNSMAELTCTVHERATAWLWSKDNVSVNILGGRIRMFNGRLKIRNVTLHDAGWYTCEATDSGKKSNRASAYLKVLDSNSTQTAQKTTSEQIETNSTTDERNSNPASTSVINASVIPFTLDVPRASVTGRSVRLNWSYPEHHPASENITAFKVELCTEYLHGWAEAEELRSYVKGTTISGLTPGRKYKFRVVAVLSGQPSVNSFPTDWVLIEQTEDGIMLPPEPQIEKLSAVSDCSLKLRWKTGFTSSNNAPEKFLVTYGKSSSSQTNTVEVDGNKTQVVINDLEPSTEYRVSVSAENAAGRSPRSQPVYARTHVKYSITSPKHENTTSIFGWVHNKTEKMRTSFNNSALVITMASILLFVTMTIILYIFRRTVKNKRAKKFTRAAKGKFADTSHRIFNEQLVLKKRLHYNNNRFRRRQSEEEYSPLQSANYDNHTESPTLLQDFTFERKVNSRANLYDQDKYYYNEEAIFNAAFQYEKARSFEKNTASTFLPNGLKDNRTTNYGELMLCSETPENSVTSTSGKRQASKYDSSTCQESASSIAGTSVSNLDTNSGVMAVTVDNPAVIMRPQNLSPLSTNVDERRNGGISKNSQSSSVDRVLQTFKPGSRNTISFLSGTFDNKQSNGLLSDSTLLTNSDLKPVTSRFSIT